MAAGLALNASAQAPTGTRLEAILFKQLAATYPGARLEMSGVPKGMSISAAERVAVADQLSDDGKGTVTFRYRLENAEGAGTGSVSFKAWKPAWVAKRRVRPGEMLSKEAVEPLEIDVATGPGRELRSQLVAGDLVGRAFEARQTILEGYPVTSGAVAAAPDVRKGDTVRVRLTVGTVVLSTNGIASEPGRVGDPMTVVTQTTKKTMTGSLSKDRTVEVRL